VQRVIPAALVELALRAYPELQVFKDQLALLVRLAQSGDKALPVPQAQEVPLDPPDLQEVWATQVVLASLVPQVQQEPEAALALKEEPGLPARLVQEVIRGLQAQSDPLGLLEVPGLQVRLAKQVRLAHQDQLARLVREAQLGQRDQP